MSVVPGRVFAIGDIHGCALELEALLRGLGLGPGDAVAFVGDYIDRGPDARQVIDLLLDLAERPGLSSVFLRGNHEDMCLAYLGYRGQWGESWLLNGGAATLQSYGLDEHASGIAARAAIPPAHVDFLQRLIPWHIEGSHLLVHAGIRPERSLADQDEEDLLWIREPFISQAHTLPYTVVFGHTPRRTVLLDLPYKIGIDTGCVYGGALTALDLTTRAVYQVRAGEHRLRTATLEDAATDRA